MTVEHARAADTTTDTGWGQTNTTVACTCGTCFRGLSSTDSEPYVLAVQTIAEHIAQANGQ
ncbi:hypothetical protein GCM10027414_00770 [Humibacter ginsengiterrae]